MSSRELREASLRVCRMSQTFSRENIEPSLVHTRTVDLDFQIVLLPGGANFVGLMEDGEARLYSLDSELPISTIPSYSPEAYFRSMRFYPTGMRSSYIVQTFSWGR